MEPTFDAQNFEACCAQLAGTDAVFRRILDEHGYPPMWNRPVSFATLIHIILEQQVSLASANAAFHKLKAHIEEITPANLLLLSDEALKACYFSRQKAHYARCLATAIENGQINLETLSARSSEEVRTTLKQVKGIGDWTVDIFLLFALQRADVFPLGDLAMANSLRKLKQLPATTPKESLLQLAEAWRPYRSVATMLLWHHYIKDKKIMVEFS